MKERLTSEDSIVWCRFVAMYKRERQDKWVRRGDAVQIGRAERRVGYADPGRTRIRRSSTKHRRTTEVGQPKSTSTSKRNARERTDTSFTVWRQSSNKAIRRVCLTADEVMWSNSLCEHVWWTQRTRWSRRRSKQGSSASSRK